MNAGAVGPEQVDRNPRSAKPWLLLSSGFVIAAAGIAGWVIWHVRDWAEIVVMGSLALVSLALWVAAISLALRKGAARRARLLAMWALGVSLLCPLTVVVAVVLFALFWMPTG